MKLADITPHDLTKVYSSLIEEGLQPSTVLNIAATATRLSKYAVRCQRIDTDFTAGAIKPKKGKRKYRVFTQEEAVRFVSLLDNERLKFPLLFMALLGMRRGEAMAVKWNKIDLDKRTIVLDSQAVFERGARVLKKPKTDNSTRNLIMPEFLVQKLQAVPGRERRSYPYNFLKLYPDALSRDFRRIIKSMHIEHMRLYDLRHTFASMNVYGGTSTKEVADQLGHASDRIVNDVYVHKSLNQSSACARLIDDIFTNRNLDNEQQSRGSAGMAL